jgi:hypothetical protein
MASAKNAREKTGQWSLARQDFANRLVQSRSFEARDAALRVTKDAAKVAEKKD